jgi:Plavaka transposase
MGATTTGVMTLMESEAQAPIKMKIRRMCPVLPEHTTQASTVSLSYFRVIFIDSFLVSGTICDEHGNDIPRDTLPPLRPSDRGPNDWTPYNDRIEFEVADFLYRRNQMSGGDANFIFDVWAASLAAHNGTPPFANHTEMYETIDSTPIGDVPWESFALEYNGVQPDNDIPSWMTKEYDAWFRNPRDLVHNIISNPDFDEKFDYRPLQEYTADGVHRFQNVMSGDWCWKQAVS